MSSRGNSTKESLLHIVDDIQTVMQYLLQSIPAPKEEKLTGDDWMMATHILKSKDEDFKEHMKIAKEQAEIDEKMKELEVEVSKQDQDIQTLQKNLKEAETMLSTALYQARMKLDQISKAQTKSVNSEDLIRFAHRISSTNAVAAPTNWQPGDPRRPYPTDLEMRMGLLAKLNDLPMSQVLDSLPRDTMMGNANSLGNPFPPWHIHAHHSGHTPDYSGSAASSMFQPPTHSSPHVGIDPSTRNHEDVEVMSTDSSSSSSSDSQ